MRALFIFVFLLFSAHIIAAENYRNHLEYCAGQQGELCLTKILKDKKALTPYSRKWFYLTGYQLDFYYDKRRFDALEKLCYQLLNHQDKLPPVVKAQIYFSLSKAMLALYSDDESYRKGKEFADKAYQLIIDIESAFPDPMRMVELANLKHVYGDSHASLIMLKRIEYQYKHLNNAKFQYELTTNLGHALTQLDNHKESLEYRKSTVQWALKLNDKQDLKIAYANLGRAHQLLEQYEQADLAFRASLNYFANNSNDRALDTFYLRLTEINLALGDIQSARDFFNRIQYDHILHYSRETYQQLAEKVSQ